MSIDQINNGTHGRFALPAGMIVTLAPFGSASKARATSSVSGLGPWGPTSTPIRIGPFTVFTEIVVEVMQGSALVEVSFPGVYSPVMVSGGSYPLYVVGDVLTATLQPGWGAQSVQWTRNGVAISGATSSTYVVTSDDAGYVLNCVGINLAFIGAGGPVAGGGIGLGYDGGNAFSVFPGDAITGGDSTSSYTLPPIIGGSA